MWQAAFSQNDVIFWKLGLSIYSDPFKFTLIDFAIVKHEQVPYLKRKKNIHLMNWQFYSFLFNTYTYQTLLIFKIGFFKNSLCRNTQFYNSGIGFFQYLIMLCSIGILLLTFTLNSKRLWKKKMILHQEGTSTIISTTLFPSLLL